LVLDNCEHLVAACAEMVLILLQSCPKLNILATSREPLRIPGEAIYRLPSLSLPPSTRSIGEDLLHFDAIRLFVERASAVVPTFAITARNARAIVDVCRRLDGIPLALELAATRVKMLSVEQIADRLNDRFHLLTGGNRLGLPRHQTLRATLDWSHKLLAEPERVLFRRLAVFAGGFDLAAAESICSDTRSLAPTVEDVLDLLGELVDKSLVVVEDQGTEARYDLLETVRQYAHERLAEAGELAAMQERHHAWYLALAERVEPALWGSQQRWWLDRLQAEHDNLRRALAWALDSDVAGALRLAGHLGRFWIDRSHRTEGRRWLERALAAPGPRAPRGRALLQLGVISHHQGDLAPARQALREAVPILRENGEWWHLGHALTNLGNLALLEADREEARRLYEEGLAVFADANDRQGTAMALAHLGRFHTLTANGQLARTLLDEALCRFRETGDLRGIEFSLGLLGNLAWHEGDFQRAKELWRESLIEAKGNGRDGAVVGAISQLGRLAASQGSHGLAVRLLTVATAAWSGEFGVGPAGLAARDTSLGEARAALGDDAFAAAAAEGQAMTLEQAVADVLEDDPH
jgi:non-specific serine/threonine protein kinase